MSFAMAPTDYALAAPSFDLRQMGEPAPLEGNQELVGPRGGGKGVYGRLEQESPLGMGGDTANLFSSQGQGSGLGLGDLGGAPPGPQGEQVAGLFDWIKRFFGFDKLEDALGGKKDQKKA
jgi:hypothetical protein